jgi:serine phosphatase RsbU (regulator of sigma subunit)
VHSDGIYEAVNGAEEPYGMERLSAALSRQGSVGTARDVRDALLRDLWTFRGTAPQQDDITLVVVRVTGAAD